jgi:hypothetical protein
MGKGKQGDLPGILESLAIAVKILRRQGNSSAGSKRALEVANRLEREWNTIHRKNQQWGKTFRARQKAQ